MDPRKKHSCVAFGKKAYFLGRDSDGINYWMEEAKWDCCWYWGGGYIETYTNNDVPQRARDIESHSHFDIMFLNGRLGRLNGFEEFKRFFSITPFTDSEIWKICELMKSFYTCRDYSDFLYCGGAHYTSNPASAIIKGGSDNGGMEYERINEVVIPALMKELYKVLSEKQENEE